MSDTFPLLVGTFNTPHIYTLSFTPPSTLTIVKRHSAIGSHSWLHLTHPASTSWTSSSINPAATTSHPSSKRNLYATAWTDPSTIVAYSLTSPKDLTYLNSAITASRSGYVCASNNAVYSAGGATGEVFALSPSTGAFTYPSSPSESTSTIPVQPTQTLSFIDTTTQKDDGSVMDFGGLRHGAHSADLSPNGKYLYIADIGRNCIWTYRIDPSDGKVSLVQKLISPRENDGPRHVWPHPNGKVVYVLQEHTCMVDAFKVNQENGELVFADDVRIIPEGEDETLYWADEVRTSLRDGERPGVVYASTRGLEEGTRGWVAVYGLDGEGLVERTEGTGLRAMWRTPNSGGWANAIQPGPTVGGVEYSALTDSEEGWVFVLGWDGKELKECARVKLNGGEEGKVEGAATAVWW